MKKKRKSNRLFPKIKELRLQNGYSEEFIAAYLCIPLHYYQHIENVNGYSIRLDSLEKLAMLYDVYIEDIMEYVVVQEQKFRV